MLQQLVWVALGGAVGSIGRYLVGYWIQKQWPSAFPWGTLVVNILGSLTLGIFAAWLAKNNLSESQRLFLMVGLCGGFTTFSTFALENFTLYKQGDYFTLVTYLTLSFIAGVGAVALGMNLGKG